MRAKLIRTAQPKIIVHERAQHEDIVRILANTYHFDTNFVVGLDLHRIVGGSVTGCRTASVVFHVWWNCVLRDETREWTNVAENSNIVDLSDYPIDDLSFEGPEHDGFIADGIDCEAAS